MKRIIFISAALVVAAVIGLIVIKSQAYPYPTQFEGYVTYTSGSPAPAGTIVRAYMDGERGSTTVQAPYGFYRLTGPDENFPTGTYSLEAEDGSFTGYSICSRTQATPATECDVVLDTPY